MSAAVVRASTSGVSRTGAAPVVTFPGTPQVGDPIGIWVTTDTSSRLLSSTPTGWTLEYNTTVVNGSRQFLHKIYASTDGTSVTLNFNSVPNMAYVVAVLDGSVHSDFGTVGTITTRPASSTTATAVATGSSAAPNLVVFHEKAATHGSAATVSPSTTTIQYIADTTAAGASTYVGTYDDSAGTADRTGTWPVASTNAAGYQIPLVSAGLSASGAASLGMTGTLSVAGAPLAAAAPALGMTGTLTLASGVGGPATLGMTGTLAASGALSPTTSAALGMTGTLSATGGAVTAFGQSGAVTPSSVRVLYATANVASARIAYSTSSTLASPSYTTTLTPDSDGIVSATLTGLAADTVYYYGLEVGGVILTATSTRGQIRTFPTAGSQANGSFLFGSCQYTDSNHAVFSTMLAHSTTYNRYGFFHLGDLHYRDWQVNSITAAATIKAQQKSSTQQPNFAALLAGVPWTYLWDNHDWGGAASDGTNPAAAVLEAMYRQMVPSYTTLSDADDASGAIDQTFDFGRISFYVMDTRSQRSPGANTDNSSKTMLGAGQKARLKAWMSGNTKPVKVILEGIPYKNYGGPSGDRWGAYLTEFAELNTYFAASGKGSLYGLSGDLHVNTADDGTNESYGHVPNAVASAFDQAESGPSASGWSQGVYPVGAATTHQFGVLDVQDTGSTIVLTFTGYDSADASNITMTKTYTLATTGPASLGMTGTLATTGKPAEAGAGSLGMTGALTASGAASAAETASLGMSGTLTASGTALSQASGSAALGMTGALTTAGTPAEAGTAALGMTGALTTTGTISETGAAALNMTGTLTATGTALSQASGAAALGMTGVLTATGTISEAGAAVLSMTGSLFASAVGSGAGPAALSMTGLLTVSGNAKTGGSPALSMLGALVATGTALAGGTGSASLSMSGALTSAGSLAVSGSPALFMSGNLTAAGVARLGNAAAFSMLGTMSGTGTAYIPSPGGLTLPDVVVGNATHNVVHTYVIVNGVKKAVVSLRVIVAETKRPIG